MSARETAFTMDTSSIKFGPGVTRELGADMAALGVQRVMLLTDARLAQGESVAVALTSLRAAGIDAVAFDDVRVEPTDASFQAAIAFAQDGAFDGYVAVGGGSVMDTAKAANLYACWPQDDFFAYVNPPIGRGLPVPGPLKPLIAVPTTAGTGSETTGVAIFDYEAMRAKTGIAQRALRPTLGIIDPHNTATLPPMVAACSGLDVLSHAIESLTALPFSRRAAPGHPRERPAYQGANPVSDVWAAEALRMVGANLLRAIREPDDVEGARQHAAGRRLRRHRLWQCRRASAARHVLSRLWHGARLPPAWLRSRPRHRAAWHGGHPQRAGGLPLHGLRQPGAAFAGGALARPGRRGCRGAGCGRDSGARA